MTSGWRSGGRGRLGGMIDRSRYRLEFEDDLRDVQRTESKWLPYYLPEWASREHTRARLEPGALVIAEDQQPWAPQYDGALRVTNVQSGVRSGPVGSGDGQLRFRDDLVVSEEQQPQRLFTPTYGLVEVKARAIAESNCMVALWMIGFEATPEQSGEICVMEIFGREVAEGTALVGMGIHPWHDPDLYDDFDKIEVAGDVTQPHLYSVEWMPGQTNFYINDRLVKTCDQAPDYPMQLMLTVYEFEPGGQYPKRFEVEYVKGYSTL